MFDKIKGFLGVNDDEYDDYPDEDMFPSRASAPVEDDYPQPEVTGGKRNLSLIHI